MSVRSFKEKGFLFNNSFIYASKEERDALDKKPYYRQSAIVFLLISIIFLLNAIATFLHTDWIFYIVLAVIITTLIYAITSSIAIEKRNK